MHRENAPRLPDWALFFFGFNLSDGIIHGYVTQPIIALFCVVASTNRELVQKLIK